MDYVVRRRNQSAEEMTGVRGGTCAPQTRKAREGFSITETCSCYTANENKSKQWSATGCSSNTEPGASRMVLNSLRLLRRTPSHGSSNIPTHIERFLNSVDK